MSRIFALVISIFIHVFAIWILLGIRSQISTQVARQVEDVPVRLIFEPEIHFLPRPTITEGSGTGESEKSENRYPVDTRVCSNRDKNYLGIGMLYNVGSNLVTYVPTFYPAYMAGIRIGDFLLNPEEPIRDGHIDLRFIRGYTEHRLRIKAELICFNQY